MTFNFRGLLSEGTWMTWGNPFIHILGILNLCFGWLLVINSYYFCLHMNNRRYGATASHAVMLSANYIQYIGMGIGEVGQT